jgi:hypothetical protein
MILSPDLDPSMAASNGVEEAFTAVALDIVGTEVGIILFGVVESEGGAFSRVSVGSIVGTRDKYLVPLLLGWISWSEGAEVGRTPMTMVGT